MNKLLVNHSLTLELEKPNITNKSPQLNKCYCLQTSKSVLKQICPKFQFRKILRGFLKIRTTYLIF